LIKIYDLDMLCVWFRRSSPEEEQKDDQGFETGTS